MMIMMMMMMLLSQVKPPTEVCSKVFKLLYNDMVVHGRPNEVVLYFRLMHALGYAPPDYAWWDRFLQRMYESIKDKMLAQEVEQLRKAVASVANVT